MFDDPDEADGVDIHGLVDSPDKTRSAMNTINYDD